MIHFSQLATRTETKQDINLKISSDKNGSHVIKRRSAPESSAENSNEDTPILSLHGKVCYKLGRVRIGKNPQYRNNQVYQQPALNYLIMNDRLLLA